MICPHVTCQVDWAVKPITYLLTDAQSDVSPFSLNKCLDCTIYTGRILPVYVYRRILGDFVMDPSCAAIIFSCA